MKMSTSTSDHNQFEKETRESETQAAAASQCAVSSNGQSTPTPVDTWMSRKLDITVRVSEARNRIDVVYANETLLFLP